LMHQVDVPKKELVTVDEKIEFLGSEFKKASELTQQKIDDAYNAQYKELSKQKNDQLSVLNDQMADLRARTESKYINSLRNNIKKNDAEINSLRAKRDSELEQVDKNYELLLKNSNNSIDIKRRNIQNQYQVGREDLKKMERDFREALDEANFFTSSTIEEKWTEKINAQKEAVENIRSELNRIDIGSANDQSYQKIVLDKQKIEKRFEKKINQLKTENRKLNIEVSKSISTKEKEIQGFIDDKRSEINGVEKNFNRQIKEISERRDNDYRNLKNLAETKRVLNEDISVLGDRRVQLREEINKRVGDSQIYRMAQWWWDKENAADISRKNVATIATVWFGSLALLIALTGVALAFASLVLGTPREKDLLGKQKPFQKLTRAVRIYLAGRNRKREVKYIEKDKIVFKEVPKEVEVQKVVFTEVPVEVVKKEIVHIPFYTNDPTLLNMNSIDSDNDDEAVFKPNNKEV